MLKKIYVIFGAGVIVFYSTAAFMGWELLTPSRNTLPPEYRNNYRGFHFWHTGFRGGK